jgi:hypothetical protein
MSDVSSICLNFITIFFKTKVILYTKNYSEDYSIKEWHESVRQLIYNLTNVSSRKCVQ